MFAAGAALLCVGYAGTQYLLAIGQVKNYRQAKASNKGLVFTDFRIFRIYRQHTHIVVYWMPSTERNEDLIVTQTSWLGLGRTEIIGWH